LFITESREQRVMPHWAWTMEFQIRRDGVSAA